ncbi:N-formylglutamate amidohydrolase [Sphingomonas sp. RB56-2]|uniref:N-formylglutamate amidohydrolase n=1 Tax=Sphingomonas brevis TaxID=2908206 RepID=A0ABT0S908_9SPHN|nr:N-formylglutamate amidohydrolase [Sphingomonas brevis]MCL6740571.1 N-formylglutamate amidohydrolase [Sphingomonas brevis]
MSRYPSPIIHPRRGSLPILLSIPHSGRDYDAAVLANSSGGRPALEMLEDPLVDRLAWRTIAAGIGAVVQPVPRAVIDCNRDEGEVDPAAIAGVGPAIGPRARHGLGLVPSRTLRQGALWRRPIDRAELERRVKQVHRPYHQALDDALLALKSGHGEAILLDCHSMPTRRHAQADVVIGDRHGTSAAGWLSAEAIRLVRAEGFRATLNDPYAGGAITFRHGQPAAGIHALQLEIDRALYLDRDGRHAGPGFDRVAQLIERLAIGLGEALAERNLREAAE